MTSLITKSQNAQNRPLLRSRHRRRFSPGSIVVYTLVSIVLIALLAPAAYALVSSLQPQDVALRPTPTYIFAPTLDNFVSLFTNYNFLPYFVNSIVSSLAATLLALLIGVPAAYALSRARMRGRWPILLALLCVRALPAIGVAVPFFVLFTALHLVDTLVGLIIVYLPFCVALVTWLMQNYFDAIPTTLDEAASLDGCSRMGTLVRVLLPLATPGLAATAIFAFLFGWNNFIYPLVLTQTHSTTVPVALTQFVGEYTVSWGQVMAGIVVLSAPLVIFSFLFKRYMVAGLSQGAMKE